MCICHVKIGTETSETGGRRNRSWQEGAKGQQERHMQPQQGSDMLREEPPVPRETTFLTSATPGKEPASASAVLTVGVPARHCHHLLVRKGGRGRGEEVGRISLHLQGYVLTEHFLKRALVPVNTRGVCHSKAKDGFPPSLFPLPPRTWRYRGPSPGDLEKATTFRWQQGLCHAHCRVF